MTYILNLETSTKNCSVALSKNGKTVLLKEIAEDNYSHAEKLHTFIADVLQEANIDFKNLKAIAISQGPGSYTGLRIGVSAAKGLCFALNIPLIAIDTLLLIAMQIQVKSGFIVPMIDARRMEVYASVFTYNLKKVKNVFAEIISAESFAYLNETVYFVGDCNEKCKPFLTKPNFIFIDNATYPSAQYMCKLSYDKYKKNETLSVAYFEPLYLKDFMITAPKKK